MFCRLHRGLLLLSGDRKSSLSGLCGRVVGSTVAGSNISSRAVAAPPIVTASRAPVLRPPPPQLLLPPRVFGAGRALASDAAALLLLPLPGDGAPLSVAAALLPPRVVHCQQRCPAMLLHWLGPSPKQHEPFGGQFCLESAWDIDPAGRLLVVGSMLRRPIRSSVLRQPLAAGCYPLRQRIRSRPADKFSADSQLLNLGSPLSAACRMCRVRPCKEHQQCVRANRGLRDERVVEGGWGCPGSNAWKVVCERVAFDFVPDKFGLRI